MAKKNLGKSTKKVPAGLSAISAAASAVTTVQSPSAVNALKPIGQPGRAKSQDETSVSETSNSAAVSTVKVTFLLPPCPCATTRVTLSGDFNGWSPDATPMKQHADGHWETTVQLPPGRYEYKFVCDGEWIPDLLARENVLNPHGTLNSVIEVHPNDR